MKPKKTAAQLEREIQAALTAPKPISAKERRALAAMARRQTAAAEDTTWRHQVLKQIEHWTEENQQGPWDQRHYTISVKRLTKLTDFIRSFFPDVTAPPIDPHDAAALIVLPRPTALRLARRLFGGGPGIAKNLQADDLTYNMDWFRPRDFQ